MRQEGGEPMEDALYTVPEVAKILKTNTSYVYKLQKSGLLTFLQIGRLKCRKESLDEFLERFDGYDISDPFNPTKISERGNEDGFQEDF